MLGSFRTFVVAGLLAGMGLLSVGASDADAQNRRHRHRHHHVQRNRGIGIYFGLGRISVGLGLNRIVRPVYSRPIYPAYTRPYAVYSPPRVYAVPYPVYPAAPVVPGVIAYKGKGLVLWNADTNSQPVTFRVDGQRCTLEPGYQITLTAKPSWTVVFDRGASMESVSRTIEDGKTYTFEHSDIGWDLHMTSS